MQLYTHDMTSYMPIMTSYMTTNIHYEYGLWNNYYIIHKETMIIWLCSVTLFTDQVTLSIYQYVSSLFTFQNRIPLPDKHMQPYVTGVGPDQMRVSPPLRL